MGSSRNAVPDAWEDDWETQADKQEAQPTQEAPPPAPMTKAERRAQHAETNRKLWESADNRETFHFVEATSNVPLASTFKPQVKVLSRKPPPTVARRVDPVTGAISQLSIRDDDDDDDEAGGRAKAVQPTPEEIRARQQREREEKQKRYDEARAKIFGESNPLVRDHESCGPRAPVTPPRNRFARGPGGRPGTCPGAGRPGTSRQENQQQQQQQQDRGGRRLGFPPRKPKRAPKMRKLYQPQFLAETGVPPCKGGRRSPPILGRIRPGFQEHRAGIPAPGDRTAVTGRSGSKEA
ncbi:conserved hypothetical protein [Verticillium alfalfae VaMs.102]|uniref:SUZ domain-containing protein n=1 Tax=Verticillium alfalfae (strain VaMs.102 / ATCC MYA-4576 / FGSC 10136) TaxID=526221 RepID=C9SIK1_VERA1|nr:conserved hypothetical protein [Verticillium alfalfae VaMs.102]EEY18774.1 conserved hypothetical protein [Verticillium alfalfae VaMs.102]